MHGRFPVAVQANFRITAYFINLKRLKKRQNKERLQICPKRKKSNLFFIKKGDFFICFSQRRKQLLSLRQCRASKLIIVFASGAKQTPGRAVKKYVILNAVKNPTEELTGIYFFTLVVGYFAYAQYDVLLLPPSGEVSATPTIGDKSAR